MKKVTLTLLASLVFSTILGAQDIIHKTDGSEIKAIVEEISETQIRYRLFDNQSGPVRTIGLYSVSKIAYANGTTEVISITQNKSAERISDVSQIGANEVLKYKGGRIYAGDVRIKNRELENILSGSEFMQYKSGNIMEWVGAGFEVLGLCGTLGGVLNLCSHNSIPEPDRTMYKMKGTVSLVVGGVSFVTGVILSTLGRNKIKAVFSEHNGKVTQVSFAPALIPQDMNLAPNNTRLAPGVSVRISF